MNNAILTKFCTVINTTRFSFQNSPPNPKWRMAAILIKRINCYISATVPPISTKFCTLSHIGPPNPKRSLKIQDGGQMPIWKLLNVIFQQPFDRFWWNLVRRCILGLSIWRSTFENPRWRTTAMLKIEKVRYLQKHLTDFDEITHNNTY